MELEDRDGFNSILISVLTHDVRQPFSNIIMAAILFDSGTEDLSDEEKLFVIKELDVTAKQSIFSTDKEFML